MEIKKIITSESVGLGHPDKICDQISDAILDECLKQDEDAKVACEVFACNRLIVIGGEITTTSYVDVVKVAWKILKNLGYSENDFSILSNINKQSSDIAKKVNLAKNKIGAGDQGVVFGYACDETKQYLPLSVVLSHELLQKLTALIKAKKILNLKYDMKSQVSLDYSKENKPRISCLILSVQHNQQAKMELVKKQIEKLVIDPIIKKYHLNLDCKKLINYGGQFIIGGPIGDTGLTGRKILADSYGTVANHGGGAFSGKDPTKVDRTGAYYARYIAKNVVAAKLARKIQVQFSYCIGLSQPLSMSVETYGTNTVPLDKLYNAIKRTFSFDLYNIIGSLHLKKPIYLKTSVFGHFGKDNLPWEKLDKVQELRKNINV